MILGILGKAGTGKSTFAGRLVDKHGFTELALADPLKRALADWLRFTPQQLWGPSEERNRPDLRYPLEDGSYLTPRRALQLLGTEVGRHIYSTIWVDYALWQAGEILDGCHSYSSRRGRTRRSFWSHLRGGPKGVVISDVRFQNEVLRLRSKGAYLIKLKRATNLGGTAAQHPSEVEQQSIPDADFDHVMHVPEGISLFHQAIDEAVCMVKRGSARRA